MKKDVIRMKTTVFSMPIEFEKELQIKAKNLGLNLSEYIRHEIDKAIEGGVKPPSNKYIAKCIALPNKQMEYLNQNANRSKFLMKILEGAK